MHFILLVDIPYMQTYYGKKKYHKANIKIIRKKKKRWAHINFLYYKND